MTIGAGAIDHDGGVLVRQLTGGTSTDLTVGNIDRAGQVLRFVVAGRQRFHQKSTITDWARLPRTQGHWQAKVYKDLKAARLPPLAWYDVLLELHRVGDAGLRQYQIGEQTSLTKHNLSRLLDRLENEALVTRRECPEDGRGNVVLIAAAGAPPGLFL